MRVCVCVCVNGCMYAIGVKNMVTFYEVFDIRYECLKTSTNVIERGGGYE